MIEEPPPLVFAHSIERPTLELVERLRGAPTSFVVDALGGSGALDWRIRPLVGKSLLGIALTCDCGAGDNLALIAAVARSEPGDVLVAAAAGSTSAAVTGDLLNGVARNRGAVGFVTDGVVRDLAGLEALNVPIYAMGVSANPPGRRGPGTVGLPIVCGGRAIASGTSSSPIVTASRSSPRDRIAETLERLERVRVAEATVLERVRGGSRELPLASAATPAADAK